MSIHRSAATLATAIRSVLCQTFGDWELLIVDDGSPDDGCLEIVRRFADPRIRIRHERENAGLAARLNELIDEARGVYFARMDSDDVMYPERLSEQLRFLQHDPAVDLVGSGALVFNGQGNVTGALPRQSTHEEICRRPWSGFHSLAHPTWLGRTDWFKRIRYRAKFRKAQDRDLLLRSYKTSRFACLPVILLGYRQDCLSLAKILRTRRWLATALWDEAWKGRDYRLLRGVVEQGGKSFVDALAIVSGLRYKLLRHRALPVSAEERSRWAQVWRACQEGEVA